MLIKFLKLNSYYFIFYILFISILLFKKVYTFSPITYLNNILYFVTFLIIINLLDITKLNKDITIIFFIFYGYVSIFSPVLKFILVFNKNEFFEYFLIIFFLRLIILWIIFYIIFYSYQVFKNRELIRTGFAFILAALFITILNQKFLLDLDALKNEIIWEEWIKINGLLMIFSILLLGVFWYRYYYKKIVFSEYLNSILFVFTLINIIEPIHIIAERWNFDNWFKGQMVSLVLNACMLILWYARWVYLNSESSIENERYLMNYHYLSELVSKPHKGFLSNISAKSTTNVILISFLGIIALSVFLFVLKKLTFFLLLNSLFITLVVLLALFFSITSIKRDWQNQIKIFLKDKK